LAHSRALQRFGRVFDSNLAGGSQGPSDYIRSPGISGKGQARCGDRCMSTTTGTVCLSRRELIVSRALVYLELSMPRIAVLVLVVVPVSAVVGGSDAVSAVVWLNLLLGTALIAASASTFNQLIERQRDAQMNRTCGRPLPAGRLQWSEAF